MSKNRIKPDTALKAYWRRNAEFADLFNAFLYGGREVLKAEDLKEQDTDSSVILKTDADVQTRQAARDLFKVVMSANGVEYVFLGIENQMGVHYAMTLRDLEYSTYAYVRQYEKIKEKYPKRSGLSGNEFLSHMKKSDKLTPVITLVIYYGEEEWDAACSLHEMMDIPDELKPFVNDFKINLIEAKGTRLIFHHKNNEDLFRLFQLMCDSKKSHKEKQDESIRYVRENAVEKPVLLAVASAAGVTLNNIESEENVMLSMFREIAEENIEIGEKRGEERGRVIEIIEFCRELGLDENAIIERIQKRLNVSPVEAEKYYKEFSAPSMQETVKEFNAF